MSGLLFYLDILNEGPSGLVALPVHSETLPVANTTVAISMIKSCFFYVNTFLGKIFPAIKVLH